MSLDSLNLKVLARVEGIPEVEEAVAEAIASLKRVQTALSNVSVTMDIE